MTELPPFEGPRLVSLLDGTLVFNDSPEWDHLVEARWLAAMDQHDRDSRLFDLERLRGVEAVASLRKTIDEVIAVEATRGSV